MERPYKLLVIDDSQEILVALDKYFKKKKFEVVTATDGLEGIKLLKTEQGGFDLVITDLVMPQIGGKDLVDQSKLLIPNIKVLLMSGYPRPPEEGAFLQKPFHSQELLRQVKQALDVGL